jgi:formylglycine-generating enzyme required for sulfatase activity
MPEAADQPAASPKPARSLTGFYVALGVVVALGFFGLWFWRAYTVWWFDADEARRRQAQAAAKLGVPVEIAVDLPPSASGFGAASGGGVKLELVLIPAGRFRMGSPAKENTRSGRDETQHWVAITRSFYMGKHEVTQEVWEKLMGTNPSYFKGAKNPVEMVSWDASQEFLKKLNALPHPVPLPPGEGERVRGRFRLPTEAEWEWACRAGTRTRFCSGDVDEALVDYAWFGANSGGATHPVGTRKPNAWGLFDMHGNVHEWCGDWYDKGYNAQGAWRNPTGPATGSDRVSRGGYWDDAPWGCRSSYRLKVGPADRYRLIGFRVVAVPVGH